MSVAALVAFSGVFALGIIFSILGSVKLKLAEALGIDDAKVGTLISALMFSSLVAVLIVGPLTDALGYRVIALVGFALGGICVWLLASALSYKSALIACLLLGIAAMCVNTVGNTLGPTVLFGGEDPARASNLLNVFFGLGAFLTPLILATLLGAMGYKKTVGLIGTILFIPIVYSLFAEFPEPPEGFMITQSLALLGNTAVLLGGLSLFCYIALEASMAGFVTTYLKSHQFSDEKAGTLLSAFWIFLMAARLVAAFTLTGIDPAVVVPLLAVVVVVAIAIMVTAKAPAMGVVGTLLAGFALGPVFPTLIGATFAKTDAINQGTAGSVFGLIFAIGLLGGITVPMLIGKYAAQLDIRQSLKIALGVAVALVVVSGVFYLAPTAEAELPEEAVTEIPLPPPPATQEPAVVEPPEPVVIEADPADAVEEAAEAVDDQMDDAVEEAAEELEEAVEEAIEAVDDAVNAGIDAVRDLDEETIEEITETLEAGEEDASEE